MVKESEIKYDLEIYENTSVHEIVNTHKDCVLVWISGSGCNADHEYGRYRYLLQFNDKKKLSLYHAHLGKHT